MHNPGLLATWLTTIIESNPIGETAFSDSSQDIKLGIFIHHPVRTVYIFSLKNIKDFSQVNEFTVPRCLE
jgi:hypothetical protein